LDYRLALLGDVVRMPSDTSDHRSFPSRKCVAKTSVMTNRSRLVLTNRTEATDQVPRRTPKSVTAGPRSPTASAKWSEGRAFLCAAPGPAAPICAALVALVMIGRPWPPACCDDHRREQGNQDCKPLERADRIGTEIHRAPPSAHGSKSATAIWPTTCPWMTSSTDSVSPRIYSVSPRILGVGYAPPVGLA